MTDTTLQVLATATSITAVAIFGYMGTRAAKKARGSAEKARDSLDTGNAKSIGAYVHDMAGLQELLYAQTRTNTNELLLLSGKVGEIDAKLTAHLEDVAEYQRDVKPVIEQLARDRDSRR